MKKVKITIEFCILELIKISNVNLHWQSISSLKKKKKIGFERAPMVVTYCIKIFRTGADKHNGILMSLLLLVAETTN